MVVIEKKITCIMSWRATNVSPRLRGDRLIVDHERLDQRPQLCLEDARVLEGRVLEGARQELSAEGVLEPQRRVEGHDQGVASVGGLVRGHGRRERGLAHATRPDDDGEWGLHADLSWAAS